MAAWLPVIKAAIPVVSQIVAVALPMFTSKSEMTERDALTTQQIEELQGAATQNAESVNQLANQVKTTFESLEAAATELQRDLKRQRQLTFLAVIFSLAALSVSIFVLAGV